MNANVHRQLNRRKRRAQQPRRSPGRMVGRVLGIPLYLNASMLLLAVLAALVLRPPFA